ncbi:unnamed protein product [Pieris macdunnoughi]|uniref:Uncharacterized protein n=1 Tax=Pieris macdunnoughi TaxID=345717 RepID=A0A821SWV8_9NEOP|nr:unnamed protein product [Pieris macdunnoughi]
MKTLSECLGLKLALLLLKYDFLNKLATVKYMGHFKDWKSLMTRFTKVLLDKLPTCGIGFQQRLSKHDLYDFKSLLCPNSKNTTISKNHNLRSTADPCGRATPLAPCESFGAVQAHAFIVCCSPPHAACCLLAAYCPLASWSLRQKRPV